MDDYALVTPELLNEQLQPEYWRNPGAPIEVGDDPSSRFKSVLLTCTHEEDKRVEITEYQAMRECLWVLVGAYEGFLFHSVTDASCLEKNRCVPTRAASLSHLSLRAFDAFLGDIAQYATDGLQIRVFLDYLTTATEQAVPLTFRLLADFLANCLSDFQTAVATLEHKVRQGELRTLVRLLQGLQPWPLRLCLVAGLLLQTVPSQLTALHSDSSAVLFLNTLEDVACSRVCCLGDVYLKNLFSSLFVESLNHYLLPVFSLDVGQLFSDNGGACLMPILRISSTDCRSVEFWRQCDSSEPELLGVLPRVLVPVASDLVICFKSICLLQQIGSCFGNTGLLGKMHSFKKPTLASPPEPVEESVHPPGKQCNLETPLISLMDAEMRGLLNECLSFSSLRIPRQQHRRNFSDRTPAAFVYKKQIQQRIREHKRQVSSLLVNLLLRGSPNPTRPYLNLNCLLTLLGNVCLFASGDCMEDFCCGLFSLSPLLKPYNAYEVDELLRSSFQSPSSSLENYGGDSWIALLSHVHFSIAPIEDATLNGAFFLDKFNRISLDIDIPWPLSVVVQSEQISVYEGVFKFILMLKWILWVLVHRCQFAHSTTAFHHRALMARMRMLFLVNGLHDFILNHVKAARSAFLREWQLTAAASAKQSDRDFPGLLNSHARFARKLSELCLLAKSSLLLRKAVLGLLETISGLEGIFCAQNETVEVLTVSLDRLIGDFSAHVTLLNSMITRTVHTNQSVSLIPLQTVFSEASFFNTNMETRLHN